MPRCARQVTLREGSSSSRSAGKRGILVILMRSNRCIPPRERPPDRARAKRRMLHVPLEHAGLGANDHSLRQPTACVWPSPCAQDAGKGRSSTSRRRRIQWHRAYPFFFASVSSLCGVAALSQWAEVCHGQCVRISCGTGMGSSLSATVESYTRWMEHVFQRVARARARARARGGSGFMVTAACRKS